MKISIGATSKDGFITIKILKGDSPRWIEIRVPNDGTAVHAEI